MIPSTDVDPLDPGLPDPESAPLEAVLLEAGPPLSLELDLHPDDAAALLRSPPVASQRLGRVRAAAVEWVWYDTPDRSLAARGLALAQCGPVRPGRRGPWRLERLVADAAWLPATPGAILSDGEKPEGLADLALAPVAALVGQRRALRLLDGVLTLTEGALRGVATERIVCRVALSGPRHATAARALALAALVRLTPPGAGLAETARAVAAGVATTPRLAAAPVVAVDADVDRALTGLAAQSADAILHWAGLIAEDAGPHPLHQMRVAVRRLRAGISFFAPVAGDATRALGPRLRDLAGRLGEARDWDVFLGGIGREAAEHFAGERRLDALLAAARQRRATLYAELARWLAGSEFRGLAMELALLPSLQPWRDDTPDTALAEAAQAYAARRLGRKARHLAAAGEDIDALDAPALHDLRKQAKRLRYPAEFLAPLFPPKRLRRTLKRLAAVQETLGAVNDEAVTAALLGKLGRAGRGYAAGLVEGFGGVGAAKRRDRAARAWTDWREQPAFWD